MAPPCMARLDLANCSLIIHTWILSEVFSVVEALENLKVKMVEEAGSLS